MVLDEVLRMVNEIREFNGLPTLVELPQGQRFQSDACVLARAFEGVLPNVRVGNAHVYNATVDASGFECWDGGFDLDFPLETFLNDFDNGSYPELVEVQSAD